jgi:1-acyl-sn-glycerol-3-phosphate acyltransferase
MFRAIISIIIWPIWSITFLFGTLMYSIAITLLPSHKLHKLAQLISRICMITGAQWFKIKGGRPDKNKGPYLYLMNHQSLFDAFMMVAGVPHYFTGVGAIEQFSYPVWGYLAKKYGVIPLVREELGSAITSLGKLESAINNGTSAMIAPEGTRSLDGKLGDFKKGAFHVAKNTGITIIPVGLKGAYQAKNKKDWRIKPSVLTIVFGQPITKVQYANMSIDTLSKKVKSEIEEMLD